MIVSRRWHRRFLYAHFPPYRWWKNSALCRRLATWRLKRSMRKLERIVGRRLLLTMERTVASMIEFQKTCEEAPGRAGR